MKLTLIIFCMCLASCSNLIHELMANKYEARYYTGEVYEYGDKECFEFYKSFLDSYSSNIKNKLSYFPIEKYQSEFDSYDKITPYFKQYSNLISEINSVESNKTGNSLEDQMSNDGPIFFAKYNEKFKDYCTTSRKRYAENPGAMNFMGFKNYKAYYDYYLYSFVPILKDYELAKNIYEKFASIKHEELALENAEQEKEREKQYYQKYTSYKKISLHKKKNDKEMYSCKPSQIAEVQKIQEEIKIYFNGTTRLSARATTLESMKYGYVSPVNEQKIALKKSGSGTYIFKGIYIGDGYHDFDIYDSSGNKLKYYLNEYGPDWRMYELGDDDHFVMIKGLPGCWGFSSAKFLLFR